ncbi:MAG: pirin family protein [Gammaproteobacteria bacterium]|nr:pirin family protein [Gammaproteobacteria bacterium]
MPSRPLASLIPAAATSDGAGVRLYRSLGSQRGLRLDPFLMLDEFFSDDPGDYIAGFPSHPHRGFETVTYMLDGHMRHEDSAGNRGDLGPGDVQWMSAARGIVHSEMPQQEAGRLRGFQLWVNLPAAEKMRPPAWRDIPSALIPTVPLEGGGQARVVAGSFEHAGSRHAGPVGGLSTEPLYLDIRLPAAARLQVATPAAHNALLYIYEGEAGVGPDAQAIPHRHAGLLGPGGHIDIRAGAAGAALLCLAGRPIGEPVAQYGPFVMNTREEIEQAIDDYRTGRLQSG